MTGYDYTTGKMEWPDRDDIFGRAVRLVLAATGKPWGDDVMVTDIGEGYAEPGYPDAGTIWVLGDWNVRQPYAARKAGLPPTPHETLPARLGRALERIGVELEWLDEWSRCDDCRKIFRTAPDSYAWRPSYTYLWDGYICAKCLVAGGEVPEEYHDNPDTAVTWTTAAQLEQWGWSRYGGDSYDNGRYENGFHAGQTDDPNKILPQVKRDHPAATVIFLIDHTGQFDIHFSAWFKDDEGKCPSCGEWLAGDGSRDCDCEGGLDDAT